ncbi:serine-rich adhesin for platelets-like [Homarus americanus]|uniref:serine-rich adhesin for platelets-like n=1 Tax=Homarus americanus TaxID=6706 RepID=UPI001C454D35|nr:serine-rich adhesin for platelets-like [Homarus americanus]
MIKWLRGLVNHGGSTESPSAKASEKKKVKTEDPHGPAMRAQLPHTPPGQQLVSQESDKLLTLGESIVKGTDIQESDVRNPHSTANTNIILTANTNIILTANTNIILTANTNITPTSSSQLTSSTQLTPTSSSQLTPTSSSQLTPTSSSQLTPTSSSQLTPTSSSQLTPTSSSQLTPTSSSQLTPTSSSQLTPTSSSQLTPTPRPNLTPTKPSSLLTKLAPETTLNESVTNNGQENYDLKTDIKENRLETGSGLMNGQVNDLSLLETAPKSANADVEDPNICTNPYPCCYHSTCVYCYSGQLCTVLGERYILSRLEGVLVLVFIVLKTSSDQTSFCRVLWKGDNPIPLSQVPDGTRVHFDAITSPSNERLQAVVIWQDKKPTICVEPDDDQTFVIIDGRGFVCETDFVDTVKRSIRVRFDGDLVDAEVCKDVLFMNGEKSEMTQLCNNDLHVVYATVFKLLNGDMGGSVSYVCTCLWTGQRPPINKLPMNFQRRKSYVKKSHGFYVEANSKFTLYCDIVSTLSISKDICKLSVTIDDSKMLLLCTREQIYTNIKCKVILNSKEISKAHILKRENKNGIISWAVVMLNLSLPSSTVGSSCVQTEAQAKEQVAGEEINGHPRNSKRQGKENTEINFTETNDFLLDSTKIKPKTSTSSLTSQERPQTSSTSSLTSQVRPQTSSTSSLTSQVRPQTSSTTSLTSQVRPQTSSTSSLTSQVRPQTSSTSSLTSQVRPQTSSTTSLTSQVRPQTSSTSSLTSQVRPQTSSTSSLTSQVRPQTSSTSSLFSQVRPHTSSTSSLTSQVRPQTSSTSSLTSQVRPQTSSTSSLTSQVRPQTSSTTSLTSQVRPQTSSTSSLTSQVRPQTSSTTSLTSQVRPQTSSTSSLTSQVRPQTSSTTSLTSQVRPQTSSTSSLTSQVRPQTSSTTSLTSQVRPQTSSTSNLTSQVRPQTNSTTSLTSQVRPQTSSTTSLTSQVRPQTNSTTSLTSQVRPQTSSTSSLTSQVRPQTSSTSSLTSQERPQTSSTSSLTSQVRPQTSSTSSLTSQVRPQTSSTSSLTRPNTIKPNLGYLTCGVVKTHSDMIIVRALGNFILVFKRDLFINKEKVGKAISLTTELKKFKCLGVIFYKNQKPIEVWGHKVRHIAVIAWAGKKPDTADDIVEAWKPQPIKMWQPEYDFSYSKVPGENTPVKHEIFEASCNIVSVSRGTGRVVVRSKHIEGGTGEAVVSLSNMYLDRQPVTKTQLETYPSSLAWNCLFGHSSLKTKDGKSRYVVTLAWRGGKPNSYSSSSLKDEETSLLHSRSINNISSQVWTQTSSTSSLTSQVRPQTSSLASQVRLQTSSTSSHTSQVRPLTSSTSSLSSQVRPQTSSDNNNVSVQKALEYMTCIMIEAQACMAILRATEKLILVFREDCFIHNEQLDDSANLKDVLQRLDAFGALIYEAKHPMEIWGHTVKYISVMAWFGKKPTAAGEIVKTWNLQSDALEHHKYKSLLSKMRKNMPVKYLTHQASCTIVNVTRRTGTVKVRSKYVEGGTGAAVVSLDNMYQDGLPVSKKKVESSPSGQIWHCLFQQNSSHKANSGQPKFVVTLAWQGKKPISSSSPSKVGETRLCHSSSTSSLTSQVRPQTSSTSSLTSQVRPQTSSTSSLTSQVRPQTSSTSSLTSQARPQTSSTTSLTSQVRPQTSSTSSLTSQARPQTSSNSSLTSQARPQTSSNSSLTNECEEQPRRKNRKRNKNKTSVEATNVGTEVTKDRQPRSAAKGRITDLHSFHGQLQINNGSTLYFSRDHCYLYGLRLHQVELWYILTLGMEAEYELSADAAGTQRLLGVWVEGKEHPPPATLGSLLTSWCLQNSVPHTASQILFTEAESLSPNLFPTTGDDGDMETVNIGQDCS